MFKLFNSKSLGGCIASLINSHHGKSTGKKGDIGTAKHLAQPHANFNLDLHTGTTHFKSAPRN